MQKLFTVILLAFFVSSCVEAPEGVAPVENFKVKRYMGKWFEIARLDHRFERGLNSVSAEYSLNGDGGITVKNSGYMVRREEWRYAEGRAACVDDENTGLLKISFMHPFYGAYVIFKLDPDYEYAYVCGGDKTQLWLLAREEYVDQDIIDDFVNAARQLGFDTSKLIFVEHM